MVNRTNTPRFLKLIAIPLLCPIATNGEAYIGPGAGLSAIGTVLAFLAAVALAIVGFVWYPMKRMRRKLATARKTKSKANAKEERTREGAGEEDLTER